VVVLSGIIIGFMGWMVWSHHMFTVGLGPVANSVFTLTTMAIAIPTGVKIFNWVGTMWKGSITLNTPMLFALGFIAVFTVGGISGVMHSQAASDAQQQDTYFIVAHIHYVLFGGSIFALMAGIFYWFPKFAGRMYNEKLGQISFWLVFAGMNITFFPMHFTGLDGMPRRIYTYADSMGWDMWNGVSTGGTVFLVLGLLVFIHNIVKSWRSGERAPGDPWDARTLEWSMSSPPPEYNFAEIPVVHDRDEWWEIKRRKVRTAVPAGGSGEDEGHSIHLPQPSYWPIVASTGLLIGGLGLIFSIAAAAVGGAITMFAIYAWSFEPVNDPDEGAAH
jgi:cytochrome c oxidase subunit 1